MASFSDNADWGSDVDDGGTKYPNDGADWAGASATDQLRVANKYDITSLPAADTVSEVKEDIFIAAVTGSGSSTWDCDGYNGDGQADPESDTGAVMFAACNVSGVYASAITDFRTTGQKSITFASQANTDIEAARDAGVIFSVAWKMTSEATANNYAEFREYTHGTSPPKLTVTHAGAGGGRIMSSLVNSGGLAGHGGIAGQGGGLIA